MREVEVMNQSAFTWSVVIAGALAAWAVAFLITLLGAGIGLAVSSPYAASSSATMNIGGALWLVFAQTAGFVTGGYLAARLRIRDHIPGPETMFRDAAHGFMVWVIGVGILAFVIGIAGASASSSNGGTINDAARQAMAYVSFWSFVALLFGAVAAPLAGMLGGELRDDDPAPRRGTRSRA
jgi:hypothetical protein